MLKNNLLLLTFLIFLVSCSQKKSSHQNVITADKDSILQFKNPDKNIDVMHLMRNKNCSIHRIKLKNAEKPHIHAKHDLAVYVLKGKSKIHFKKRSVTLKPGDLVYIPRNEYHWAENIGNAAAEVLVIFSPPFDGKDRIPQ